MLFQKYILNNDIMIRNKSMSTGIRDGTKADRKNGRTNTMSCHFFFNIVLVITI